MSKRKIIKVDEAKCNGCGDCAINCPEGALKIIHGKARLVGEIYCDGLGACIGQCPLGAISVEEREAEIYDENKVMDNIVKRGEAVIIAHLQHLQAHQQKEYLNQALRYLDDAGIPIPPLETVEDKPSFHSSGCPGSMTRSIARAADSEQNKRDQPSTLEQWPIQLHLLNPNAPYFQNADLLIAADCVAFSQSDFHQRFLKGKKLAVFCPKLDNATDEYIEKLTQTFQNNTIQSITILYMEVPCCFGTVHIVKEAIKRSGKDLPLAMVKIGLSGDVRN